VALPVPHFELPWEASEDSRLTFTYPSGGTDYNVDIDTGDGFDCLFSVLVEIASQLSTLGVTAIWPVVTEAGLVQFFSTASSFDLDLSTSGAEVQAWLGFTTGTFGNVSSATADGPCPRTFWPGTHLRAPPTMARSRNLLQARAGAPNGHAWLNIVPVPGGADGFLSSRFGVNFLVAASDYSETDQADTQWYRLVSFLSGRRAALSSPYDGGWYSQSDLEALATWDELDALRERGASEHRFAFFSDWADPDDYTSTFYSDYAAAQEALRSYWHLHPDVRRIAFSRTFEPVASRWSVEFDAFQEVS